MKHSIEHSIEQLDWENFNFPISLFDIKSESDLLNQASALELNVWRNEEFKLVGEIKGIIQNDSDFSFKSETLFSSINEHESYKLLDCQSHSIKYKRLENSNYINFSAQLTLGRIFKYANTDDPTYTIIDWHLSSKNAFIFPRQTLRLDDPPIKHRTGLDPDLGLLKEHSNSGLKITRDHFLLQFSDLTVIIQEIENEYLPEWANGIAIEYNGNYSKLPDSIIQKSIAEFIKFALGIKLFYIGNTCFNSDNQPISNICYSPRTKELISSCKEYAMPPITFRENAEIKLSQLLFNYILLRDKLDLKDVLWKLDLGQNLPIGINLPIFASGIESLASKYLKAKGILKEYPQQEIEDYKKIIQPEIDKLGKKLDNYQFKQSIISKIENPTNYSIGEKLKFFLDDIGFDFDSKSIESKAIRARNKMAHTSMSNITESKWNEYFKLSQVYITVYNRIILKLIGYEGEYIDYYSKGHPLRLINENIKNE